MSSNSLVSNETQQISHELNVDSASNDVPIQRPIGVRSPAVKRRNKSVVWDYFKITSSPNKKVCQVENCNFKYSTAVLKICSAEPFGSAKKNKFGSVSRFKNKLIHKRKS